MRELSKSTCKVGTARIGYLGRAGDCILDTTVKSGTGLGVVFAPTWDMVMAWKHGVVGWEVYRERYTALMRQRYAQHPEAFLEVLHCQRLILCCYCKDTHTTIRHCHRYLLVEILEKVAQHHGISFEYVGEVSNRRT